MPSKKDYDISEEASEKDRLLVHQDANDMLYSRNSIPGTGLLDADPRTRGQTVLVTLCILVMEMCERLTYYSIVANLVLYCTSKLDIGQADATTLNQVFTGCVYLIAIAGGFISDVFAGRFRTILGSSLLYLVGAVLLPASAIDYETWEADKLHTAAKTGIFMTGLFFVALGTGGIKANVGPFAAEQVESLGEGAVRSLFNWFYWVVNVGALIAYAGVSYIQQNVSFAWGFFVPLVSMICAVIIFVAIKSKYVRTHPKGLNTVVTVLKVVKQGAFKSQNTSALAAGAEGQLLARAKKTYGGKYDDHVVDGVVSVIKVIPFCLMVIMYWAIYSQMSNTFFAQSERLDLRLGDNHEFTIPAAALNVFNTISIILLIPVVDRFIYPCFTKIGRPLTYLKRMGIGMNLSVIAVIVAGVVEIYRKNYMESGHYHVQSLAGQVFNASSMSVFVQIPQFALIGASEIFTSITTLEFAYNQAPVVMQGLLTGLFLAASGVGSWVSSAILSIVEAATEENPWWCNEINECHMEYLLFLLGGLMFVNFLVFCLLSHFYTYQDPASFEANTSDDFIEGQTSLVENDYLDGNIRMKNAF